MMYETAPAQDLKFENYFEKIEKFSLQVKWKQILFEQFHLKNDKISKFYKFFSFVIFKDLKLIFMQLQESCLDKYRKKRENNINNVDQYIREYLKNSLVESDDSQSKLDLEKLKLKTNDEPTELEEKINDWCKQLKVLNKKINELINMVSLSEYKYYSCYTESSKVIKKKMAIQKEAAPACVQSQLNFLDSKGEFKYLFLSVDSDVPRSPTRFSANEPNKINLERKKTSKRNEEKLDDLNIFDLKFFENHRDEIDELTASLFELSNKFNDCIKRLQSEFEKVVYDLINFNEEICGYLSDLIKLDENCCKKASRIEYFKKVLEKFPNNFAYLKSLIVT